MAPRKRDNESSSDLFDSDSSQENKPYFSLFFISNCYRVKKRTKVSKTKPIEKGTIPKDFKMQYDVIFHYSFNIRSLLK